MNNTSEFPRIGEHHPDGPAAAASLDNRRQSDTLNFGWFSLPQAKKGCVTREDQQKISAEVEGVPDGSTYSEINQRPLSKDGQRPDIQQRATPQQCASPNACPWPNNQIPVPQHCIGQPDNVAPEGQEQGFDQRTNNQLHRSVHDENVVVEWPLSIVARGNMVKPPRTPSLQSQPRTPMGRPEIREVPPTPLPPLQWQGYQSSSRPTYSSWRDTWYQSRDVVPTMTRGHGMDSNNSNRDNDISITDHGKNLSNKDHGKSLSNKDHGKSLSNKNRDKCLGQKKHGKTTMNNRGKNINNNNEMYESLTTSYSNKQLVACNYSADGNNNNWMAVDDNGSSVKTQVTTIPPYEQSSETVPSFYNPSVVMKWEDTEDQSNSMHEKQTSLMKRIRSSFFQMWSILSCLKNQDDEAATQNCRSFKYDRFDYNDTFRSNEQGAQV